MNRLNTLPRELLVKIIEDHLYKDIYVLSTRNGPYSICKVCSSWLKLLKNYLEICKDESHGSVYGKRWRKELCEDLNYDIKSNNIILSSNEAKEDLLNFINDKPYKGVFTPDDLNQINVYRSFQVFITKIDG